MNGLITCSSFRSFNKIAARCCIRWWEGVRTIPYSYLGAQPYAYKVYCCAIFTLVTMCDACALPPAPSSPIISISITCLILS